LISGGTLHCYADLAGFKRSYFQGKGREKDGREGKRREGSGEGRGRRWMASPFQVPEYAIVYWPMEHLIFVD